MYKKKALIYMCSLATSVLVTACSTTEKALPDNNAKTQSPVAIKEGDLQKVTFTNKIQELEDGFSYVSYEGDYGFEQFINAGGASSDAEVIRYLTENVLLSDAELSFGNDMFGCSTVSVQNPEGEQLFGRNFDWQTCNALVVKVTPEEGYSSISTVNTDFIRQGSGLAGLGTMSENIQVVTALYAPLDGMNEKGFCVSVNMIQDGATINQDTEKRDITTTTAVRLLLNNAATVEEAITLLQEYDLHSSMGMMIHLAMSDHTGRSVVVEYVENEMIVVETPVVTNFYLAEGEKYGVGTAQSHERYRLLMERIQDTTLSMDGVRDALDRVSKDNFKDSSTTEWSAVFNQSTKEVRYYHREDYSKGYQFQLKE
ncbi:MAG: linear amide C-N hydrolase [bacterium]|nr:linear amide C-N hydrolase [bacterium]